MAETKRMDEALDEAAQAVLVETNKLDELSGGKASAEPIGLGNLMDVPVKVTVEVGRTRIPLGELVKLGPGSLLVLDRESHEPADILVNGKIVARGEVVTIDGAYGVRVTAILNP
jgi:flagellar motor switch protein FliN/FliY